MSGSFNPCVFFSYSPERSGTNDVTKSVVTAAKDVCHHRSWTIKDPLEEQGTSEVNTKVIEALEDSDAVIFVWQGEDNSNTGFETGYATALGYPIIVLRRTDTKEIFPDLGNREYITHAKTVHEFKDKTEIFKTSLARVLTKLETDQLTPGLIAIRHYLEAPTC